MTENGEGIERSIDDVGLPERPVRRVSLGLSRGGEMHVSLPGNAGEPVDEKVIEALRTIGEAALDKMYEGEPPAA